MKMPENMPSIQVFPALLHQGYVLTKELTTYDRIRKCSLFSSFHMFELNTNKTHLIY